MGRSTQLKLIYYIGDLIALNLAIALASLIKFYNGIEYHATQYPILFAIFNISWLAVVVVSKAYDIPRTDKITQRVWKLIVIIFFHALLISAFWVGTKAYYYSREFLALTYIFFTILILFWRMGFLLLLRIYRKSRISGKNVIIYGYGEVGIELEQFFTDRTEFGYRFKGYFDDDLSKNNVKGNFDDLKLHIKEERIEEIYCSLPDMGTTTVKELIDFGEENLIKVKLLSDFRGFSSKGLELRRYDNIPILDVTEVPLDDWRNRAIKRTFDILFSLFVILTIFPWLFPIIALAIKLTTKGPIFFKQSRTGKGNNNFGCYKFRTMGLNAESDSKQAEKYDERITKVGEFLRSMSLDELPQFFNVLIGDMSVIGPRPHPLLMTKEYTNKIEKFMARHLVKPGITGLAQAKGYRGPTSKLHQMSSRVKLDRFYIENWSLMLDIKILALTAVAIIRGNDNAF